MNHPPTYIRTFSLHKVMELQAKLLLRFTDLYVGPNVSIVYCTKRDCSPRDLIKTTLNTFKSQRKVLPKNHATSLQVESEKSYTTPEFSYFPKARNRPSGFSMVSSWPPMYVRLSRNFWLRPNFRGQRPFAAPKAVNKGVTPCPRHFTMAGFPSLVHKLQVLLLIVNQ